MQIDLSERIDTSIRSTIPEGLSRLGYDDAAELLRNHRPVEGRVQALRLPGTLNAMLFRLLEARERVLTFESATEDGQLRQAFHDYRGEIEEVVWQVSTTSTWTRELIRQPFLVLH